MDNLTDKYNRFIIYILALAPFAAWFTVSYFDMDLRRIIQLLSYVGVFLILILKNKPNLIRFPNYLFFYLLFILYDFFSLIFILDREFKIMYLFSNTMIGALNLMFIIENLNFSKKYFNSILKVSKYTLIIAVLVIIIQQVFSPNFFLRTVSNSEKIGITENEIRLVSIYSWIEGVLAAGFSFVPILILLVENFDKKKKKIFIWILMGVVFAILSKARWIMLNTLLVFVALIINNKLKASKILIYSIFFPLLVFISFLALDSIGIDAKGIVNERILESDKKDFSQKSASTRILAFEAFDEFFWDQPFFGKGNIKYGMGSVKGEADYKLKRYLRGRSSQMHVGYLSLFYIYGIIGGFLFLSFLYFLLKKLYKNAKITGFWSPFLGFLGFAIANLTLVTFTVFEMGLIIVLVADKFYSQNTIIKERIYA